MQCARQAAAVLHSDSCSHCRGQPPDPDVVARVPRVGALEEDDRARALLVREHLGTAQPRAVVDRDMDVLPANPRRAPATIAVQPVAGPPPGFVDTGRGRAWASAVWTDCLVSPPSHRRHTSHCAWHRARARCLGRASCKRSVVTHYREALYANPLGRRLRGLARIPIARSPFEPH